jgi:hypothetical protein
MHRLNDGASNAVGRLCGLEIGFESIELGLKRHDGSPLAFCVEDGGAARFVEVTPRRPKAAAVRGSRLVGLAIILLGNDQCRGVSTRGR